MLWRTAYSATQRRRAKVFRPATAAAHITYDRHISKRQRLNAIFTRGNPNIGINKCPACRSATAPGARVHGVKPIMAAKAMSSRYWYNKTLPHNGKEKSCNANIGAKNA